MNINEAILPNPQSEPHPVITHCAVCETAYAAENLTHCAGCGCALCTLCSNQSKNGPSLCPRCADIAPEVEE